MLLRRPGAAVAWILAAASLFAADDVKVAPGAVEDQRSSDGRMGGLTIGLKLTGSGLAGIKAIRWRVKTARDDRGMSLYRSSKDDKPRDFEEFAPDHRQEPRVNLLNPGRDAATVDVAGEVELFIPARDPATRQRFENFLERLDKPISNSALKSARVGITLLSAAAYKERERQNRPTKEEIMAEGKKHGASEAEIRQAMAMIEAVSALGGEEPTENSVLIETKDPDGRIISIDVVDAEGKELRAPSRGTSGAREVKMVKIDLAEKPPAGAALMVTMRTPKSVVTVPLNFKALALP